jgi:aminopeptidase N
MLGNYSFDAEKSESKSFELPGAKPHYNPDRTVQVNHIFLDLDLDIAQKAVDGICHLTLTPVREGITQVRLDAVDFEITEVKIGAITQPFDHNKEELIVDFLSPTTTEPFTISITYQVKKPRRGIYFITPDDHYPDKATQVWTQGEDEDSRFWFPCFDYPGQLASSEIRVKVPQGLTAVSNGALIAEEAVGDKTVFHWQQQEIHPSYLIALAVGDFAYKKDSYNGLPVTYYVDKRRAEDIDRTMGKTPRMVEFLGKTYGYPYAYPKYAQVWVEDFIFGGMENTSVSLMTDRALLDERASQERQWSESLVLHELAHQWFGDLVVIKHWSHAWIKEGMATYAEVLWTEHEYGKDDAAYYLLAEARNYLQEDRSRYRRPIVTNIYREAIELYDRHLYEKGGCVYHMIRSVLGDKLFTKAMHQFVNHHAHDTVETIDLLRAIEVSTGYNLAPLFDQYVFRGGHPDFDLSYSWDRDSSMAKISVKQTQAKPEEPPSKNQLFNLLIPLGFGYVQQDKFEKLVEFKLKLNEPEQTFYFPLEQKPDFVSFDVGNNYLKTVKLNYPQQELIQQLHHDPDSTSRIYAAIALGKKGGLDVVEAFTKALTTEQFWGVRVEIAKQLGKIQLNQAIDGLAIALKDENPKVRRAAVEALGSFPQQASYDLVKAMAEQGDPSYHTEASAVYTLGKLVKGVLKDKVDEVISFFKQVLETRSGWNELVRSGAISGLGLLDTNPNAAEIIIQYTKLGTPQPLRLAAIRALGGVSKGQKPEQLQMIVETLEAIAAEEFFLTQVSVVTALKTMGTTDAARILGQLSAQTPDGRVKQRADEARASVEKSLSSDKQLKRLQDKVDQLQKDNQDLQSRLAKLEASQSKD